MSGPKTTQTTNPFLKNAKSHNEVKRVKDCGREVRIQNTVETWPQKAAPTNKGN